MVVNEVTSCVQSKGTKTVITAAVAALVAGGAVAADEVKYPVDGSKNWAGTTITGQKGLTSTEFKALATKVTANTATEAEKKLYNEVVAAKANGALAHVTDTTKAYDISNSTLSDNN